MPETVCVTVEQLRSWEEALWCVGRDDLRMGALNDLKSVEYALGEIANKAERLKGWTPKVGAKVRLKADPELGLLFIGTFVHGSRYGMQVDLFIERENGKFLFGRRYLAELMPAEAE